jgi:hypothetical protein
MTNKMRFGSGVSVPRWKSRLADDMAQQYLKNSALYCETRMFGKVMYMVSLVMLCPSRTRKDAWNTSASPRHASPHPRNTTKLPAMPPQMS